MLGQALRTRSPFRVLPPRTTAQRLVWPVLELVSASAQPEQVLQRLPVQVLQRLPEQVPQRLPELVLQRLPELALLRQVELASFRRLSVQAQEPASEQLLAEVALQRPVSLQPLATPRQKELEWARIRGQGKELVQARPLEMVQAAQRSEQMAPEP